MDKLKEKIQGVVRKNNILCEELTEKQLVSVICQAIEAGDFSRHTVINSNSQAVTYVPGRRIQEMQNTICDLKNVIRKIINVLY